MIDVSEAHELTMAHALKLDSEQVELENLVARVPSEPILASRIQPPFNRVAMDGIAIKFDSINEESFKLLGIQKAGEAPLKLEDEKAALEVMTGSVLPFGTDTVIPYERIEISEGTASLLEKESVTKRQNIHFEGSDYDKGKILLNKGTRLNSAAVAIIASQGATSAKVVSRPKVAIISTGDELIEPGQEVKPWQIYRSNAYAIKAELISFGFDTDSISLYHLEDEKKSVYNSLKKILSEYSQIIISGGVSMGKFDFVQSVMSDLNVKSIFYKIKQKPGKPMFFGKGENSQCVFALPGNPVSALFCMRRYVIPSLQKSLQYNNIISYAKLTEDVQFKKEFTLFKAVSVSFNKQGELLANPISSNGSGDFSSLGRSDGFIELPAEDLLHKAGNVFKFFPWSEARL